MLGGIMKLYTKTVTAKTRKIKATWSRAAIEDLRNYHSIDPVAELENTILINELLGKEKPKGKQIFSDIDPYGEECWD
jgi:hypothetical protein